jgi:hypothetical protein
MYVCMHWTEIGMGWGMAGLGVCLVIFSINLDFEKPESFCFPVTWRMTTGTDEGITIQM